MRATRARRALLGSLALLAVLATPASARADVVTDWNATAAGALASPGTAAPPGAGQGAIGAVHLAMVHGAVYDAVNAIAGGHKPYVSSPAAEPWYSQEAAVAAAARHMLLNGGLNGPAGFAPARIMAIETAYLNTLAGIPPGAAREGGIATGVAAATAMIAARAGDGRYPTAPFYTFPIGTLPGEWRPTSGVNDPAAWLKDVRPFVLRDTGPVPRAEAACAPHEGLRRRLQRGQGDRAGDRLDQDAGADGRGELLGPDQPHRDDRERAALGREHAGRQRRRPRAVVREHVHEHRRRAHRDVA